MAKTPASKINGSNGANLGFEADLWRAADALRSNMDAAEYKHVVLGLIFLKYISDAFEEQHAKLEAEKGSGADPEDPDEYRAVNIFWVPKEARWAHLKAQARQPTIGRLVDDAMTAIECDNPALKGVLPKDYARPALDKSRLGQLIDLITNIRVGDQASRAKDVLGRVYEYFLSQFASAEGKKGGEFYTPRCVVKLLVEMLEPYRGRVYDPCCGSGGMFVQSEKFIEEHGGKIGDISVYGQESNHTTWRLAKMNLAIRGIEGQIAHGDNFHNEQFPDLRADFILANPPFNVSDWGGERLCDDKRWKYGVPPASNANFAWVQHFIHHLAPAGVAGFVLANGFHVLQPIRRGGNDRSTALIGGIKHGHRKQTPDRILRAPGQRARQQPARGAGDARDRPGRGAEEKALRLRPAPGPAARLGGQGRAHLVRGADGLPARPRAHRPAHDHRGGAQAERQRPPVQGSLFEELRDEPLREAIEFYQHKHGWTNRLIAGDSLLVMNSLLEKEGMAGKVQMIYIDPPYGIRYGSNFQPFVNKRDVKDGKDEDLTSEPEQIRAFRDTWELGIHSYLTYLRDRLLLARELLTESGSIFVQISDENVHHVRELMDEVFGNRRHGWNFWVFDPTCGSGTTAYVAEQWGRRWITCDTSRVALTLARQRLMTAVFKYYELAHPQEGVGSGFKYKTVPHVTLKSIANNPEIDGIYARMHPAVEQALAHLNAALKLPSPAGRGAGGEGAGGEGYPRFKVTTGGRAGQFVDFAAPDGQTFTMPSGQVVPANELVEWEVPFAFPADWPEAARAPFDRFHAGRRALQKEIDAAIARHAPQETLYDQPFVDRKKVRVTGPFTVEAVPAPAVKSVDDILDSRSPNRRMHRSPAPARRCARPNGATNSCDRHSRQERAIHPLCPPGAASRLSLAACRRRDPAE
jgi:hypothetical protein